MLLTDLASTAIVLPALYAVITSSRDLSVKLVC